MIMVESCDTPDKQGTARSRRAVEHPAYSGHTAWVMAIMSELAYMRFEDEDLGALLALPAELGKAMGRPPPTQNCRKSKDCCLPGTTGTAGCFKPCWRRAGSNWLECCPITTPTPRASSPSAAPAMKWTWPWSASGERRTCRTGCPTCNTRWTPADSPQVEGRESMGKVHKGFLEAFSSVKDQVDRYLPCAEGLPVFITGHSLGGALATLGAAHLSGWGLAACYTFGAPRVGNKAFAGSLQTPVYRVVNPGDPVPHVPTPLRGYRHAGDRRRLKKTSPSDRVREIWNGLVRLWRLARWQELSLYLVYDTWIRGTISASTGRSCEMTLAVWSDTGPSARPWDGGGSRATPPNSTPTSSTSPGWGTGFRRGRGSEEPETASLDYCISPSSRLTRSHRYSQ